MPADKIKSIVTAPLTVKWSNLLKPDDHFGEGSANHNITVILTPEFEAQLMEIARDNGVKVVNGTYEKDGVRTIKFKSKTHIDKGAYPCQDSTGAYTDSVPFGSDVVRLRLGPAIITKGPKKSMSFYLNGVQLIQKNASDMPQRVNGFNAVEGGYVGNRVDAPAKSEAAPDAVKSSPAITDEEIPF
jgi:hypothetical protein